MFWWYLIFTVIGFIACIFAYGSAVCNTPPNGHYRTERLLRDTNIDIVVFGCFFLILGYENTQLFMWFLICKFTFMNWFYNFDEIESIREYY
jgi:hypothetical protein